MTISAWDSAMRQFPVGSNVTAVVTAAKPFGLLVDISGFGGIIERIQMEKDGYNTPYDYPPIGSQVRCEVIGYRCWSQQLELCLPARSRK